MSKKILVVEDDEKNRELVRDVLKYYGYEVREAKDGAEGIKMAEEHMPDLILMDIQLPVMDGITAMMTLKNNPGTKGIKIIALSAFAMKGDKEEILEAGFDDYITKPLDTRQLPGIVKRHF
ncbi:MAG: response regulator [Nitrospirae bacterium]|nr:response regulator [Nitrospirota bacterium]